MGVAPPKTGTCPSCGHCNECGRGGPYVQRDVAPYAPYAPYLPVYPLPHLQPYLPTWWETQPVSITYGTTTTTNGTNT